MAHEPSRGKHIPPSSLPFSESTEDWPMGSKKQNHGPGFTSLKCLHTSGPLGRQDSKPGPGPRRRARPPNGKYDALVGLVLVSESFFCT